jgi:hypothetical protein
VPRRPDSHDEFELALGEAMRALQLGNCDLVRLRGTSDGGVAVRLCGPHSRAGDPYTRSIWRRALFHGNDQLIERSARSCTSRSLAVVSALERAN